MALFVSALYITCVFVKIRSSSTMVVLNLPWDVNTMVHEFQYHSMIIIITVTIFVRDGTDGTNGKYIYKKHTP